MLLLVRFRLALLSWLGAVRVGLGYLLYVDLRHILVNQQVLDFIDFGRRLATIVGLIVVIWLFLVAHELHVLFKLHLLVLVRLLHPLLPLILLLQVLGLIRVLVWQRLVHGRHLWPSLLAANVGNVAIADEVL